MKCTKCDNDADWVRSTPFSSDHHFCTEHALKESNFGINDGHQAWCEIVYTFIPNKFSEPIIFKRGFGKCNTVEFSPGFCQWEELKDALDKARSHHSNKLHKIYKILRKYAIQEKNLSPESSELIINIEKYTDDVNLGVIDKQTYLDITCLEKEGHIIDKEFSMSDDFIPLKKILFSFLSS